MKAIRIGYTLKNDSTMKVGILADNSEQAVKTLLDKQKDVKSIIQVEVGMDIHVFSENVTHKLLHGKKEIKELKGEFFTNGSRFDFFDGKPEGGAYITRKDIETAIRQLVSLFPSNSFLASAIIADEKFFVPETS